VKLLRLIYIYVYVSLYVYVVFVRPVEMIESIIKVDQITHITSTPMSHVDQYRWLHRLVNFAYTICKCSVHTLTETVWPSKMLRNVNRTRCGYFVAQLVWYFMTLQSLALFDTTSHTHTHTHQWWMQHLHDIFAPFSAVGRLLLQARLHGTCCQTISVIRRLAKTLLGDYWKHTCLRCT